MVRQGLQGQFWQWLRKAISSQLEADIYLLTNPQTTPDQVQVLRGSIKARNEFLMYPQRFVEVYDYNQLLAGEMESPADNLPTSRRLSPVMEDSDGRQPAPVGQPDIQSGQP